MLAPKPSDFNADGVADGLDFVLWNGNKFRSSNPRTLIDRVFASLTGDEHDDDEKAFSQRLTAKAKLNWQ